MYYNYIERHASLRPPPIKLKHFKNCDRYIFIILLKGYEAISAFYGYILEEGVYQEKPYRYLYCIL
jgi:hypothetical protein